MAIRKLFLAALLLALAAAAGCATYRVRYDYETGVEFGRYRTFDWMAPPRPDAEISSLTIRRIRTAVQTRLREKGYDRDEADPDFLIAAHTGRETKIDVVDWGYHYGGFHRYHLGYHMGYFHPGYRIDVYQYQQGTLILDFVDRDSREMIWRGTVTRVIDPDLTPEERERVIGEAVSRVLENFPPPRNEGKPSGTGGPGGY